MVAQGVGRFARRAGADKRRKLSVAITVEKCIIFCMLERLREGELEETATLRVYLRVYVLDVAAGRIVL
jgi:hypothetical protein